MRYASDPCDRFWSKVDKQGPVPAHAEKLGRCWQWIGGFNKKGYGRFASGRRPARMILAHRYSWGLAHGDAGGECVLHRCDNPRCVRPDHLFIGDRAVNNADMQAKGRGQSPAVHAAMIARLRREWPDRWPRGSRVVGAKLDEAKVSEIRAAYAGGNESFVSLATRFGVGRTTIESVIKRRKWAHVG